MRPLTEHLPKPMLRIGGVPILEYNVRLAARHGFTDLVINVHHEPHTVVGYFADGAAFGVSIRYSYEETLRGTAGALDPVRAVFEGQTFAVLYGDNITTCDLTAVVARHRDLAAEATIALFSREDTAASGIVALDDAGLVTRFVEKPAAHEAFSTLVNAGVLLLEPSILDAIPKATPSDFGRDILPALLANGSRVAGYTMSADEKLWWIDSPHDYARTLAAFGV